jgi:hypothetical protein
MGKLAKPGKIEQKIFANRNFETSAGFDDRDDCRDTRSGLLATDMYPPARTG